MASAACWYGAGLVAPSVRSQALSIFTRLNGEICTIGPRRHERQNTPVRTDGAVFGRMQEDADIPRPVAGARVSSNGGDYCLPNIRALPSVEHQHCFHCSYNILRVGNYPKVLEYNSQYVVSEQVPNVCKSPPSTNQTRGCTKKMLFKSATRVTGSGNTASPFGNFIFRQ